MTWFAFKGYNTIDVAGVQEKELAGFGFHGYATKAEAEKNPNSVNLLNKWLVDAAEADYRSAVSQGEQPGGPHATLTPKNAAEGALQGAGVGNPLKGVEAIGDFFHRLTESATWVRAGEVGLGVILIYAGVRALSHGSVVAGPGARASVTRPVKKVTRKAAKIVVPEARLAGRVAAKKVAPKTTARVAAHRTQVAKYGAKKPYSPPS